MRPPPLVILDCDGVLVDSERLTNALLAEMATEVGLAMTMADSIARFKGRELREIQAEIEGEVGRPLGEGFLPEYRARMAQRFEAEGVPPIDGAPELLRWLDDRTIPHAVASNGPQEKMRLTLSRVAGADWFARFEGRRFSAYDLDVWKPDPGLFLAAAEHMGAAPQDCIVVEDSVSGVVAGVRAGMRVVGFADLTPPDVLRDAGAADVVVSHDETTRLLGTWLG